VGNDLRQSDKFQGENFDGRPVQAARKPRLVSSQKKVKSRDFCRFSGPTWEGSAGGVRSAASRQRIK